MSKFRELGIPFPLFEGEVEGSEYSGIGTCSLCTQRRRHIFALGVGCAVMFPCPRCGTVNGLRVCDRKGGPCRHCRSETMFPDIADEKILCCFSCLRAGKAALTKDTELGMISWEQAFEGVTHGVPGLNNPDFEMVPKEDDWVAARLLPEYMFELLRTPCYSTWQGECGYFAVNGRWFMSVAGTGRISFSMRPTATAGPCLPKSSLIFNPRCGTETARRFTCLGVASVTVCGPTGIWINKHLEGRRPDLA
jgi:hypothetical protein